MDSNNIFDEDIDLNEEDEEEEEEVEEQEEASVADDQDDDDEDDEERGDEEDDDDEEEEDAEDGEADGDGDGEMDVDQPEPTQKPEQDSEKQKSSVSMRQSLLERAKNVSVVEVLPIVAIPHATPVYSIALTKGPRWLFTGGEDGFIRKYDLFASVEGKMPLTSAQKHQLVDSISYGGMLCSYWENEQPYYREALMAELAEEQQKASKSKAKKAANGPITTFEPRTSPVYSMAADSESRFLLSGLGSGGITLQTVRASEGSIQYYFKDGKTDHSHSDSVSCLKLNNEERRFLSGSWDMKIIEWDLDTGKTTNLFDKSTGQISSIEYRPVGGIDLPVQADDDLDSLFGDEEEEARKQQTEEQNPFKEDIKKVQDDAKSSGTASSLQRSDHVFLSSSVNGTIKIWDSRLPTASNNVVSIPVNAGTTPWCTSADWSNDGNSIYVGRRNAVVEEYDIRRPNEAKQQLKFPIASGPISVVRQLPNPNYLLCGCQDNIRLYDLRLSANAQTTEDSPKKRRKVPFMIIPGHNGGILSDLYVDPTCRFMVSSSGNRGWQGKANDYVFIYEILGT